MPFHLTLINVFEKVQDACDREQALQTIRACGALGPREKQFFDQFWKQGQLIVNGHKLPFLAAAVMWQRRKPSTSVLVPHTNLSMDACECQITGEGQLVVATESELPPVQLRVAVSSLT